MKQTDPQGEHADEGCEPDQRHQRRLRLKTERQPWDTPEHDEIWLMRNFGAVERIKVPHEPGGHFGGDPVLHRMLFKPGMEDPLGQRAGSRAGAMAVLCGIAAAESMRQGRAVTIAELNGLPTG